MGIIPILQRRKLRHREVKWCRQSYAGRLVTCLRLERNLFISRVPLPVFSSRLHLFTRPLPRFLQNRAPLSLPHRKLLFPSIYISSVSQVSEPYKPLHIYHCFEILLSSSTMLFPERWGPSFAATPVLCHTSQIHPHSAKGFVTAAGEIPASPLLPPAVLQPRGPFAALLPMRHLSWMGTHRAAAARPHWRDLSSFWPCFCPPAWASTALLPFWPQLPSAVSRWHWDGRRYELG